MSKYKLTKKSEETILDKYFKVDQATFETKTKEGKIDVMYRMKLYRPDAVAAIVFKGNDVILVKQFRYPVANLHPEGVVEIVAGKIDGNDAPLDSIKREIFEEIGYDVPMDSINALGSMLSSPGYSTETIFLYSVEVTDEMKTSEGGGLADEHEDVEIIEMNKVDFWNRISTGEINDAKTMLSAFKSSLQLDAENIEYLIYKKENPGQ
jgi:nudix-type nucleoside diphosphatase (YffH/AdpP family)